MRTLRILICSNSKRINSIIGNYHYDIIPNDKIQQQQHHVGLLEALFAWNEIATIQNRIFLIEMVALPPVILRLKTFHQNCGDKNEYYVS